MKIDQKIIRFVLAKNMRKWQIGGIINPYEKLSWRCYNRI